MVWWILGGIIFIPTIIVWIVCGYRKCPVCGNRFVKVSRKTVKDDVVSNVSHITGKCKKCGYVIDRYEESANIDPDAMP